MQIHINKKYNKILKFDNSKNIKTEEIKKTINEIKYIHCYFKIKTINNERNKKNVIV